MTLSLSLQNFSHYFSNSFTRPTYNNLLIITVGCILTTGRRTITNILRVIGPISHLDQSSFHRIFSQRKWSLAAISRNLINYILTRVFPEGIVMLAIDDTVTGHPGAKVYGKGRHRDAVRSSHTYTAFKWGHKWIVISILIKFPFSVRPFALPVMVALYRTPDWNNKKGHTHKTPSEIAMILLKVLIRWFPERHFIVIGDSGFSTNPMAIFCHRYKKNLTLIGKLPSDANLYEPAPPRIKGTKGRPRKKGRKLPHPKDIVAQIKNKKKLIVNWYGGEQREIEIVTYTGGWHKSGRGDTPIRWVYVHDLTGTHRDEYFFTTDLSMSADDIIEGYTGRWSLETTFQECKEHLKIESTRGYVEKTILRVTPSLFCLYTIIVLLYYQLPTKYHQKYYINWKGKSQIAFSDIIACIRRILWKHWVFEHPSNEGGIRKLSPKLQDSILDVLILNT